MNINEMNITEEEFLYLCKKHLRIMVGCWKETEKKGVTVELQFKTDEKFITIAEAEGFWRNDTTSK